MSTHTMEDLRKTRAVSFNTFPGINGKGPAYGSYPTDRHSSAVQAGSIYQQRQSLTMPSGASAEVSTLSEDLGRMNVQNANYAASANVKSTLQASAQPHDFVSAPVNSTGFTAHGQASPMSTAVPIGRQHFMYSGHVMYPGSYLPHAVAQSHTGMASSPTMYAPAAPHYIVPGSYGSPHQMIHNHSPLSQGWVSRVPSGEMPTLITPPRDSTSSNEDDAPGTPFTQYTGYGAYQPSVAYMDRSPHSLYAWSTPSPAQPPFGMAKAQVSPQNIDQGLLRLIRQAPPIPPAVPSTTPLKSLDRCLENPHGITNVYIRGLQPNTTDEMLYNLASRFGEIASSKSIIDHATGHCKGYGFVKFHNYNDAMTCIRGFHAQGYETSFARESFYSQLKKLSDEANTNLYVSNLPKEMIEHELGGIFTPHKVCSSRILRDAAGNGRGVGFARFESRDVCDEVIKKFNNMPITTASGQEYLIQIRFADTQEQKALKHQTTQARDWRSQEYEAQVTGSPIPPQPYIRSVSGSRVADHDFETYMTSTTGSRTSSDFRYPQNSFGRFARERLDTVTGHLSPEVSPGVAHFNLPATIKLEQPGMSANKSIDGDAKASETAIDATD